MAGPSRSPIFRRKTNSRHRLTAYDFVIVGAGSAGCVLANRLSAGSHRVLLLEAGPPDRRRSIHVPAGAPALLGTELDWGYLSEPQAHVDGRRIEVPRGRTLGGSSSINAQVYLRGHRADFDRWAELGSVGWEFDGVLPYFDRADRLESRPSDDGHPEVASLSVVPQRDPHPLTDAFVEAAVAVGLRRNEDLNTDLDGVGHVPVTQRRGARWSTASAYLRPARVRPHLAIATGAQATRVLIEGRRAVGVEYRRDGQLHRAYADEVILSGGVINSPQLLMISGVGPPAELQGHGIDVVQDLPGVGRNLQDHTELALGFAVKRLPPAAMESAVSALRYAFSRRGRLTSGQAEAAAFVGTDPSIDAPDLELLCMPPRLRPLYPTPRWAGARAWELARVAAGRHHRAGRRLMTIGSIAIQPGSVGSLRLRSADPFAPARIDPNYLSEPADVRVLIAGVRLARQVMAAPPLSDWIDAEVIPGPAAQSDEELEVFARHRAGSLAHLAGTCKMGIDEAAVVDPELRVRGIEGLRVVDASVMPQVTRGHLNAPTVMIAERAADLILAATSSGAGPGQHGG